MWNTNSTNACVLYCQFMVSCLVEFKFSLIFHLILILSKDLKSNSKILNLAAFI